MLIQCDIVGCRGDILFKLDKGSASENWNPDQDTQTQPGVAIELGNLNLEASVGSQVFNGADWQAKKAGLWQREE